MFTEYSNLPKDACLWIYQADRDLTRQEVETISKSTRVFTDQWTSHGKELKSSFITKYHRFLILALDQHYNAFSGCAIDASIHFIKQLEQQFNINFLDKTNLCFKKEKQLYTLKLNDFKKAIKLGSINLKTIVFNNMVATKHDFETRWEVVAKESWHQRFFNTKMIKSAI